MKEKKWSRYLWIASSIYMILGFFNIMFAWLGLICFLVPLLIALLHGEKTYCNRYCGRGQLFDLLGNKLSLSQKKICHDFCAAKGFVMAF